MKRLWCWVSGHGPRFWYWGSLRECVRCGAIGKYEGDS